MKQHISCIYSITHIISKKRYIGSAAIVLQRWYKHKYSLRVNKHPNSHLQAAWNKYGESNFKFEIIEECSKDKLIEREQYWIDFYDSANTDKGYNICSVAGNTSGRRLTSEAKIRIGKASHQRNQGINNPMFGKVKEKSPIFNIPRDIDTKHKIRLAHNTKKQNGLYGCSKSTSVNKKTGKVYISFAARIRINGKLKYLGKFKTELEAHEAYVNFLGDSNIDLGDDL
jgi:group I intron endonuclease